MYRAFIKKTGGWSRKSSAWWEYRRHDIMQIVKAGALYFALVFGAGFVLGPIRRLWFVPRFAVPSTLSSRLGMGSIALSMLPAAEFGLVLYLRGLSI
jgi:hypothetical protein